MAAVGFGQIVYSDDLRQIEPSVQIKLRKFSQMHYNIYYNKIKQLFLQNLKAILTYF